jgi:hypothetical protein
LSGEHFFRTAVDVFNGGAISIDIKGFSVLLENTKGKSR